MAKKKRADPLVEALENNKPYTITLSDGGDLASMRAVLKHGQSLTFSPIEDISQIQTSDIVLVNWRGGNTIMHLIGEIRNDQFLIVNSLGKENGWVGPEALLGRVTAIVDPDPQPEVPEMLVQLAAAFSRLVVPRKASADDVQMLFSVVADLRWYAATIGEGRWTIQPAQNKWSFAQHLWHLTREAKDAAATDEARPLRYFVNHGKEHVGRVAEALAIFERESVSASEAPEPTPYEDLNAVLAEFLSGLRVVLKDELVGLYLFGSLAMGDFNPKTSDVDFLVVTAGELSEQTLVDLEALHARLVSAESRWAVELEGSYIPQPLLRRHDPNNAHYPHLSWGGGPFRVEGHGSDWIIQRHVLRESGLTLAGPEIKDLIDPVAPVELRQAVLGVLEGWWVPMLADPVQLQDPKYRAYAVLTMCRMLYTLEHGSIVSKPAAGRWAQENLDDHWTSLIQQALAYPDDLGADNLDQVLAFITYTAERSRSLAT